MSERLQKRLLNAEEAGTYLSMSAWTIRYLIRQRQLPFVPFGRSKRVDVRDLDKWIELNKETHLE